MAPLVETVIGDAEEPAGDGGMNYLVLDLCTTLLRWTPLFPRLRSDTPDKRLPAEWSAAAQCLVNHIVSCCCVAKVLVGCCRSIRLTAALPPHTYCCMLLMVALSAVYDCTQRALSRDRPT